MHIKHMKKRGAAGERSGLVLCGKSSLTQGSRGADAESAFFLLLLLFSLRVCMRERERTYVYLRQVLPFHRLECVEWGGKSTE